MSLAHRLVPHDAPADDGLDIPKFLKREPEKPVAEVMDAMTGEIVPAEWITHLPADPSTLATTQLVAACERVFEHREHIIETATPEMAIEAMRRASAIERYLKTREHKAAAQRAARVLETAVGEAMGPPPQHGPGRGKKVDHEQPFLTRDVLSRFRRMAEHRRFWLPVLEEKSLSRKQALDIIDNALKQDDAPGETCTVEDLHALVLSGKRFGTIYIDPPWRYDNQGTRAATNNHYRAGENNTTAGMTVGQIAEIPVGELAARDAHLHLWTTNGFLFECPKLFEAWGFEFRSTFVWVKPEMGIGNYWRNSHEIMLTAIRGNAKRFEDHSLKSWIECSRGGSRHSTKPEQVRHFIERASPGARLELFARNTADGWTVWGNDIQRTVFNATQEAA